MNSKLNDKTNEIMLRANEVKTYLQKYSDCPKNKIDGYLSPVRPYIGNGDIKLIIVGQDPTVSKIKRRQNVKCTLMLDEEKNNLRKYVDCKICKQLGYKLDNVYATNLFKFFYTHKPTDKHFDVLKMHLPKNLQLLKDEINSVFEVYPECQVITLGEPVLKLLVNSCKVDDMRKQMKYYWGYVGNDLPTNRCFHRSEAFENKLGRVFYPFVHQPVYNMIKFYHGTFNEYAKWMKMCIE